MRYGGWRRLRGDTAKRADLLDVGKKLLAALQFRRSRGGPKTVVQRVSFPDGSRVTAGFTLGHPYIDVYDAGGGSVERYFEEYAVFTDFDPDTGDGQIRLLHVADYVIGPGGPPVRLREHYRIVSTLTGFRDPNALAISDDGRRIATVDYGAAYIEVSLDGRALSVLRSDPILAGQDLNFYAFYTGTSAIFGHVVGIGSVAPVLAKWLAVPVAITIGLSADETITAMCSLGDSGRIAIFAKPAGSGPRLIVYNAVTGSVELSLPPFVPSSLFSILQATSSQDGRTLYVTGENLEEPGPLQAFVAQVNVGLIEPSGATGAAIINLIRGGNPAKLALSPDERQLYVMDNSNSWFWRFETQRFVDFQDTSTPTGDPVDQAGVVRITATPTEFAEPMVTLDGARLIVTAGANAPNSLRVYDTDNGDVVSTVQTGSFSYRIRPLLQER